MTHGLCELALFHQDQPNHDEHVLQPHRELVKIYRRLIRRQDRVCGRALPEMPLLGFPRLPNVVGVAHEMKILEPKVWSVHLHPEVDASVEISNRPSTCHRLRKNNATEMTLSGMSRLRVRYPHILPPLVPNLGRCSPPGAAGRLLFRAASGVEMCRPPFTLTIGIVPLYTQGRLPWIHFLFFALSPNNPTSISIFLVPRFLSCRAQVSSTSRA